MKELMSKITVTILETFERCYELEVDDLNEDTLTKAVDAYNADEGCEPEWICTSVANQNDEIVAEW